MIVISHKEAKKIELESLFKQGGTISLKDSSVFCTGKYKESIIGSNVVDIQGVKHVYGVKKYDSNGSYIKLYSIKG